MEKIGSPRKFNFSWPTDYKQWRRRFERYREASKLAKKDEGIQVSMLMFAMGSETDNILDTFDFGEFDPQQDPDPSRDYGNVMNKFNEISCEGGT